MGSQAAESLSGSGLLLALAVLFALLAGGLAVWLAIRLRAARAELRELTMRMEKVRSGHRRVALRDALTGVANRRQFDESLGEEWARGRRTRAPLALLLVDIDHFKRHNDRYGHQAGDECLKVVAATLAAQARRADDLVARYGGEEFAVLLPSVDARGAEALAERMRSAIEAIRLPYMDAAARRHVTASIGVAAVVPSGSAAPAQLVSAADEALYRAKAVGRNQVIVAEQAFGG
jgi:diguanylate cyclase (GGDEF)-like protein